MAETKWTNEQLQAIKTRRCNLLVAAAAGSGKTAVLVERIIKIITNEDDPVDIDRLLVVTFTSAAASEMRERIALAISKELEKNPSSKVLQRQLTLLSRSNITTMHSFCLDVIKNYFHTIDLDPSFRIGDETEGNLLKSEIIDTIFEEYYENDDEEFKRLVDAYGGNRDDAKLKDIILSLYRFCMSGPWPEKWLNEKANAFNIETLDDLEKTPWVQVLKQNISVELEGIINSFETAIKIINETDGLEPYLSTFQSELDLIVSAYASLSEGLEQVYKALNNISFGRIKTIKKSAVSDEEAQSTVKSIRDGAKKKISKMLEDTFSMPMEEILFAVKSCYPYMKKISEITLKFMHEFAKRKKEKNLLDFNDLEHFALKIISDTDDTGNIIPSKVGEYFKEYFDEVLVDEYQDSNNVQETIINLISRKNSDNPNVFMVGDVKQSIYRFRQAKPELFLDKYEKYSLEEGASNRKIQLYKNFRSRFEVIEGSNYIFKQLMSKIVGELEYNDNEKLNLGASFKENIDEEAIVGGPIELNILDKSGMSKETQEDEEELLEEEDLDAVTVEARIVASRIKSLMNGEHGKKFKVIDKVTGEYRDLRYKDIVILLRATKGWSEVFLDELGSQGIPIYADTTTGYFESIEIRTIMSLLKIIDNPMQDVPLIAVLRSPIFNFTEEEMADIRLLDKEKYFYELIVGIYEKKYDVSKQLREKCLLFLHSLSNWREKSVYTPIDEFIWYIYMDTAYYGYVGAMPNGKLRQANLKILFQRAKQYEETSFKGLFNFINFINKLRRSSGDMGSAKILGENEDVVRIMSIHKSKGLEFPVVFLSGTGKQFNMMDLTNSILFHEELGFGPEYVNLKKRNSYSTIAKEAIKTRIRLETLSEEMRILYVAFTRAKEKLIITGATRDLEKSCKQWASAAQLSSENILSSEVLKGKSYLDWIGMALCNHPQGADLRDKANAFVDNLQIDLSTWKINFWTQSDIFVDENIEPVDNFEEQELFINKEVQSVDKEIDRRLGFKYKYNDATNISSNVSVSELKKAAMMEYEEISTRNLFDEEVIEKKIEKEIPKPKFLIEQKTLTSAEKGTIMHFMMQHVDFNRVKCTDEIKVQIQELIDRELLTRDEASVINPWKIFNFFKSDLGKRMIEANKQGKVYREIPFFTEIPSTILDYNLDENIYKDEKVRLQGIIDCFFEEDNEIVLVDYKTDYVEEGKEEEIVDRYRVQIKYYKDAIEKMTDKKVKESYLYLFKLDKSQII